MKGPRGLPHVERVATYRTHTIPLLARRRMRHSGVDVRRARPEDLADMAALWARLAPGHQLATVYDAASFAADRGRRRPRPVRLPGRPSLRRAARRVHGRVGPVRHQTTRVTGYYASRCGAAGVQHPGPARRRNQAAPSGGALHNLTAVQVCVPPEDPGVLRALVIDAYNDNRRRGFSFLNVGLDTHDPLAPALKGLLAQPPTSGSAWRSWRSHPPVWSATAGLPITRSRSSDTAAAPVSVRQGSWSPIGSDLGLRGSSPLAAHTGFGILPTRLRSDPGGRREVSIYLRLEVGHPSVGRVTVGAGQR